MCLGRADTLDEMPFQTARREAWEEIGLPDIDQPLPCPFSVEHLCELPANLAKTELVVRPCVALLHSYDAQTGENADPEVSLIPSLNAGEVAAIFTAPFRDFLRIRPSSAQPQSGVVGDKGDPGDWYRGSWSLWHNSNWRSKIFFFFSPLFFLPVQLCSRTRLPRPFEPCIHRKHMGEGVEKKGMGLLSNLGIRSGKGMIVAPTTPRVEILCCISLLGMDESAIFFFLRFLFALLFSLCFCWFLVADTSGERN